MREIKILQDICLKVFGVSLADIDIKEFDRLTEILLCINVMNNKNFAPIPTDEDLEWATSVIEDLHKEEVKDLFCGEYCLDFYLENRNDNNFTVSCPNCRKEHGVNADWFICDECDCTFDIRQHGYTCPNCHEENIPF